MKWPEGFVALRHPDRPTLVVCIHPKCPCSHATVSELERLLARPAVAATHPLVLTVITIPAGADHSWTSTTLVQRCQRLPEARVEFDPGGRVAAAFGAVTSGEVLLFDSAGKRMFAGGVTASRGHEGASAGGDALAMLLAGRPSTTGSTPVFGCGLVAPAVGEPLQCEQSVAPETNPLSVASMASGRGEKITFLRAIAPISDPASKQGD